MGDDHMEGNAGVVAESPLLVISSSSIEVPELELTSVSVTTTTTAISTRDVARSKFRSAIMKLRCISAFTVAAARGRGGGGEGDYYEKVQNELILDGPHTEIDIAGGDDVEGGEGGFASALEIRLQMKSYNKYKPPYKTMKIVLDTVKDPIIVILLLSALFSLGFGLIKHGPKGCSDGLGIFSAVFIFVAVTSYCKIWPKRQIFSKLAARAGDCFTVDVMRNGTRQSISVFDVVVGDVVFLQIGDQIPADGVCIEGHSFLVVEEEEFVAGSSISEVKEKDCHRNPLLFSGSKVVDGSAKMLVTAVGKGMNAKQWHWNMLMSVHGHGYEDIQKTPLERKLVKLARFIAKVGFAVAFLVFLIQLIRYFKVKKHQEFLIRDVFFHVIGILVTPIAIASTAIPEGLLLAVIVPVAYLTNRMAAEDKALVRKLAAVEEIGSTTVICTNGKGDLLSQNLQVTGFWHGQDTFSAIAPNVRNLLLQGAASGIPESTESNIERAAIRKWAYQPAAGIDHQVSPNAPVLLHQRGDLEVMLSNCYRYYDRHGNMKEITNEKREILKKIILDMKSKFPQCIGFSCSDDDQNQKEECFTLIGVAGLGYPCLPGIKDVVNDCKSGGVDIKLVTRSELAAAIAMAYECGIFCPDEEPDTEQVIEGHDFQNRLEQDRLEISKKIRVMARASTFDRHLLVQDLKKKGHVVAVTGDSERDADVLKEANVGLSLGIQGTNIAKENSDIIILNDNFGSIATVLRWGRSMYCKIQTYTQFQLTVSITSLVIDFVTPISAREPPNINVVATISAGKAPFAALLILWAKLIVGVLAALAITIEEPPEKLQDLPSVKRTEPFVTKIMWKKIVGQALYIIIILLTMNFKGTSVFKLDPKVKDTMIFNTFVLWQLVSILKTKKFDGINFIKWIQKDKLFWSIFGSMGCLQVVIIEALERFAGTKRLNLMEWAECIGIAVLAWPTGWLVERCISFTE